MIRRFLFNFAVGLSMLICLAAGVAWFRSMRSRDAYRFHRQGVAYAIASVGGRIVIDNDPQRIDFARSHPQSAVVTSASTSTSANGITLHSITVIATAPPPLVSHTIAYYWMIVIVAAVLPSIQLLRWAAAEDRIRRGDCPTCGYNLTGNASGVCPECGTPISTAAVREQ